MVITCLLRITIVVSMRCGWSPLCDRIYENKPLDSALQGNLYTAYQTSRDPISKLPA